MLSETPSNETSSLLSNDELRLERQWDKQLCRVASIALACFILISMIVSKFRTAPALIQNGSSNSNAIGDTNNDDINGNSSAHVFPDDFVWGSATSSYQVEGATQEDGRGLTIWDTFCYEGGHVLQNATGDVACDHYHLYKKDVKLMKELNLKAYRFSIAWSRILPSGRGDVNLAGIAFYNRLIDTLIYNDIEPWITLYHWDLPQELEDDVGGWLDYSGKGVVADAFGEYARICFEEFGDRVKHFITLNEPWTVAVHGYNDGIKAPGRTQNGTYEPYIAAHNLLLAHAKAASIYKEVFAARQKGIIGMANCADYRYPLTDSPADIAAAERAMAFQFGWFMEPVIFGDYPRAMRERVGDRLPEFTEEERSQLIGSCDFLGINTYSSGLASKPETEPTWGGYWADVFVEEQNDPSWGKNYMGWAIVPHATRELLSWIKNRYGNPLMFITENGTAENEDDVETAEHDEGRRSFFEGHLRACAEAIEAGARLGGYFAWSLMDNFEWEYGYQRRFGLCFVDFKTQVRTPKSSAIWYSKTIESNGRNIARRQK